MKPSRKLKIAHKILLLFGVLLVGFVLIGFAYKTVVDADSAALDRALERRNSINDFSTTVEAAYTKFLEARRYEKELPLYKADKYIERHGKRMDSVKESLSKYAASAPSDKSGELIRAMLPEAQKYKTLMASFGDSWLRIGLDPKSGLLGELREAAHGVDAALKKYPDPAFEKSFLLMRRHERGYLLREWDTYIGRMAKEQKTLVRTLSRSARPTKAKQTVGNATAAYHKAFLEVVKGYKEMRIIEKDVRAQAKVVQPIFDSVRKEVTSLRSEADVAQLSENKQVAIIFMGFLAIVGLVFAGTQIFLWVGVRRSLRRLHGTVESVALGDHDARARLTTGDELQELGDTFDSMLDEKGKFLRTEEEHEALNNSIIGIMKSVAKLGKGDLTVTAPVNEDITGALSDAINSMAESTSNTLAKVRNAAEQVRLTSQKGRDSVLSTAKGMNEIRSTIQETGKRIKQLGERSQEIGGIVKVIDDIAERTSVLALNANMQAANAGEAGRGFRVVADEVQRLAERSKEATDQIAKLVNNIQNETSETIATMDRSITEVVKGGELAELAAAQVRALEKIGQELSGAVSAFKLPQAYTAQSPAAEVTELEKARQIA